MISWVSWVSWASRVAVQRHLGGDAWEHHQVYQNFWWTRRENKVNVNHICVKSAMQTIPVQHGRRRMNVCVWKGLEEFLEDHPFHFWRDSRIGLHSLGDRRQFIQLCCFPRDPCVLFVEACHGKGRRLIKQSKGGESPGITHTHKPFVLEHTGYAVNIIETKEEKPPLRCSQILQLHSFLLRDVTWTKRVMLVCVARWWCQWLLGAKACAWLEDRSCRSKSCHVDPHTVSFLQSCGLNMKGSLRERNEFDNIYTARVTDWRPW